MFDIVIVNWNAGELLRECLDSIEATGAGLVEQVIVVDNASADGSADAARGRERTTLIEAGENLGFGKGCNRGAAAGRAPWIVFLNPDTRLFEGALQAVRSSIEDPALSRYGIFGIRLVDEHGVTQRSCARFPSVRHYVGQSVGLSQVMPRLVPPHFMTDFDHLSSRPVDQPIGAFNAVERELFERLGGFDEEFFVYMEDVDLSRRAAQAGRPAYYIAEAAAFHKGGGTSDQVKARRLFYLLRSRIIYAFKTFGMAGGLVVAAVTLTLEFAARLVQAGWRGSISETWGGYRMLWQDMPGVGGAVRRVLARRHSDRLHTA
jgi:N-acetylglucosaminyl-diphospho-decaprenol L-rhamnosyltransferase